ncbi:CDP-alcohol phosphatidyltransferase family protein [Shouchella oshimensis]|uniref:CDP-alcohol phosphatidyltransferase family protein n=1 Tax=Alkalicoccobacillus plakortidis TaxID=444060 RepID=A0A9D5DN90_9BACI|nr:CDP-alcohol phosphatidyltransferase family protein [Shouchella oshimensis]KQL57047.1 hypothetical protein AN965_10235 [Alkalicoccobacillus plakortidis]
MRGSLILKNDYPIIPWESEAIKKLRAKCQKPTVVEEPFARFFLRRISIYFTIIFNKLGLTPNFVSFLSLLFFFLCGFTLIEGSPLALFISFICYVLGYLFDCVDGEMARLRKITSQKGAFLDNIIRGNTVIISFAVILSIVYLWGVVPLGIGLLLYTGFTFAFLSLQIPLSYELTFTKKDEEDPVYRLRKRTFFDQIAFWTGVPGFFTILLIFIPFNIYFSSPSIYLYFLLLFTVLTFAKAILRGVLTYIRM